MNFEEEDIHCYGSPVAKPAANPQTSAANLPITATDCVVNMVNYGTIFYWRFFVSFSPDRHAVARLHAARSPPNIAVVRASTKASHVTACVSGNEEPCTDSKQTAIMLRQNVPSSDFESHRIAVHQAKEERRKGEKEGYYFAEKGKCTSYGLFSRSLKEQLTVANTLSFVNSARCPESPRLRKMPCSESC